jgi:hypothetical protein
MRGKKEKRKEKLKKVKNRGPCIYLDWSTKGGKKRHNTYRADVSINGLRHRKRNKDKEKLEKWLDAMTR